VQVAVFVCVVVTKTRVASNLVFVKVFVDVVVTAFGVTVFVFLAVALGIIMVVKGPTSVTSRDVVVSVTVETGIVVVMTVIVGVYVLVACGPTVR
jgi:hypothetical protein